MNFKLIRHKETDYATYGRLYGPPEFTELVCVTLELPWVDANEDGKRDANVSRIPPGSYRCVRRISPKRGYEVWWLCDVPGVSSAEMPDVPQATTCQIHRGNLPDDLRGCIAIGSAFGPVYNPKDTRNHPGIQGSRWAFERFMNLTRAESGLWLSVVDQFVSRDTLASSPSQPPSSSSDT